jgi:hypothetical protein
MNKSLRCLSLFLFLLLFQSASAGELLDRLESASKKPFTPDQRRAIYLAIEQTVSETRQCHQSHTDLVTHLTGLPERELLGILPPVGMGAPPWQPDDLARIELMMGRTWSDTEKSHLHADRQRLADCLSPIDKRLIQRLAKSTGLSEPAVQKLLPRKQIPRH